MTLNAGFAIQRLAGAWMLVMGDFFRSGRCAHCVANVFNVRTGNKVRAISSSPANKTRASRHSAP